MTNSSDSEKKYRTNPGGDRTNHRKREENCFKFFQYLFCFYNLCLLVGNIDALIAYVRYFMFECDLRFTMMHCKTLSAV